MRILVFSGSKEYLVKKLKIEERLAESLAIFFKEEKDKELKKFIIKKIKEDIRENEGKTLSDNQIPIIDKPSLIKDIFPFVEKSKADKIFEHLEKSGIKRESVEHALNINEKLGDSGNYAVWLAKRIQDGEITPVEDNDQVLETLREFSELKNSSYFPEERKEINSYRTLSDLRDTVSAFKGSKSKAQKIKDLISENVKTVYEENGVKIIELNDPYSVSHYANGASWCVADITWARKYFTDHPKDCFYIVFVEGKRECLIHQGAGEIKDEYNVALSDAVVISRIKDPLDKIGVKSSHGDFKEYRKAISNIEKINSALENGDEYEVSNFKRSLIVNPRKYSLLNEENRTEDFFISALNGWREELDQFISSSKKSHGSGLFNLVCSELNNLIGDIPRIFLDKIKKDSLFLKNLVEKLELNEYFQYASSSLEEGEMNYSDIKFFIKQASQLPSFIAEIINKDIANTFIEKLGRRMVEKDEIGIYKELSPYLRSHLNPEVTSYVKRYFLDILEGMGDSISGFFKMPEMPDYLLYNESFIKECAPFYLKAIEKKNRGRP